MTKHILFSSILLLAACSESQVNEVTESAVTENTVENESSTENNTSAQPTGHLVVAPAQFKELISSGDDIQLVDARTPAECANGVIGNAVNIDFLASDFDQKIAQLDKNKPVYIYCAAGGRSGKASEKMISMGFNLVYDLQGGYNGWPYK